MTKPKQSQIVIRISKALDRAIKKAAEKKGLTKASWGREVFIDKLGLNEVEEKHP